MSSAGKLKYYNQDTLVLGPVNNLSENKTDVTDKALLVLVCLKKMKSAKTTPVSHSLISERGGRDTQREREGER